MSTHLLPTHRYDHEKPESFLAVAGTILAVPVILIALAVAVAVASGAGACN